jgi:hypothetical protein
VPAKKVKKNAIMMIDFALEAERGFSVVSVKHDDVAFRPLQKRIHPPGPAQREFPANSGVPPSGTGRTGVAESGGRISRRSKVATGQRRDRLPPVRRIASARKRARSARRAKGANQLKPEMPETLSSLGKAASMTGENTVAEQPWLKVIELEKNTAIAAQAYFGLPAYIAN